MQTRHPKQQTHYGDIVIHSRRTSQVILRGFYDKVIESKTFYRLGNLAKVSNNRASEKKL